MTTGAVDLTEAFFHRRSTHKLIDELSGLDSLALYVGAGASIERTGLSWAGLSAQLLDPGLGSAADRTQIVRLSSPLAVSSAVAQQFESSRTDGWRIRLREAIGDLLYRGPADLTSYMNDRAVALANEFIRAGKSAVIVTPNYDRFLLDAVDRIPRRRRFFSKLEVFAFGVDKSGESISAEPQLSALEGALSRQRTLCIVYLHGYVDRTTVRNKSLAAAFPVVSERDYSVTRSVSQNVLHTIFARINVLLVGSSVTDPPLIHALATTREAGLKRFAIVPSHAAGADRVSPAITTGSRKVDEQRAEHLGLRLIVPPFFYQAPQILEEVRVDLTLGGDIPYSDPQSLHRYGTRLTDWWWSWLYDHESKMVERQADAHKFLEEQALPLVRDILNAPDAENLKLEAWIRWRPEDRKLALWASSTGTWPDFATMREDPLSLTSDYAATHAFLNGAPTYFRSHLESERWKSYLSKPIRYLDESNAFLPVGVITVASMKEQDASSIDPHFRAASSRLYNYLDSVGIRLFGPEEPYFSELDESESESEDGLS